MLMSWPLSVVKPPSLHLHNKRRYKPSVIVLRQDASDLRSTRVKAMQKNKHMTKTRTLTTVAELSLSQLVDTIQYCAEKVITSADLLEVLGSEMANRKGFLKELTDSEIRTLIHCFGMLTNLGNRVDQSPSSTSPQTQKIVFLLMVECVRRGIHKKSGNVVFRADVVYGAGLMFSLSCNRNFRSLLNELMAKFLGSGFTKELTKLHNSCFFDCAAHALLGCAKLGYIDASLKNIPPLVVARLEQAGGEQSNIEAKHLTMLLSAECKLRLSDPLLAALINKISMTAPVFDQWELSSVVTALAEVGYGFHTTQGLKTMSSVSNRISEELCSGRLTNPGCLANIVVSFGKMKFFDQSLVNLLGKSVRFNLNEFSVDQISDVIHHLARFRRSMPPTDLQRTIKPLLRDVSKRLKISLDEGATLSCGQISSFCWSMSDFAYVDQDLFFDLVGQWLDGQGSTVSEIQLARVVHSSAVLSIEHKPLLEFTKAWVSSNVGALKSVQTATSLLWSLSVFDEWPPDLLFPLVDQIDSLKNCGRTVKIGDYHRISQCHSLLVLSQQLDTALAREFHPGALDFLGRTKDESRKGLYCNHSRFQEDVACVIEELGFDIVRDSEVVAGCVLADVLIEGHGVVVEADGPSHFAINSTPRKPHPLGGTLLRNRLLQMAGFKVVVIPVMIWRSLDAKGRSLWLKDAIDAAISGKSGKSVTFMS